MAYVFEDKEEMAKFFLDRAAGASGCAARATTQKERAAWTSAAATWEQAAAILRETHWAPEVRADKAGFSEAVVAAAARRA